MRRTPLTRKSPLLSHKRPKTYHPKRRTRAEMEHHDAVAELGCRICKGPAEIHHLKHDPITGQHLTRRDHRFVIPLCPMHHRLGGWGVAFHAGSSYWESIYGTEVSHWRDVHAALGLEEAA